MSINNTEDIDAGAKLKFEEMFHIKAQQKKSKLQASRAVVRKSADAKTVHLTGMDTFELKRVDERNPLKNFIDYRLDNRHFHKLRYATSVLIDAKQDVNELLLDPSSAIMQNLLFAQNRLADRVVIEAATAPVFIGGPDQTQITKTFQQDGGITIDATGGLGYSQIQTVMQKFINNDLQMEDIRGTTLCLTGVENTALMNEEKFINNNYVTAHPVEQGIMSKTGVFDVLLFAGSETGGITVENPMLKEAEAKRTCLALAPESIALAMKVAQISVEKQPQYLNSKSLTVEIWIGALRMDAKRIIALETTI